MEENLVRKLLLAISIRTGGDYDQMMAILYSKEYPPDEEIMEAEKKIKSKYVTFLDEEYPPNLRMVTKPPLVLYYYGDISLLYKEKESIAVIGSREASLYGVTQTKKMVEDLAANYVIVSGLAKGIDATAHEATLNANGQTIAVLGSGIDYCYPYENRPLYNLIKERGLVISEYPNATMPAPICFPMRNRIIAGLAKGILITEARKRSGTLITVSWGQSFSKEVMCVPYRPEDDSACNQLIKEGAFMVENSEDVMIVMDGTRKLKKTLIPS